MEKEIKKILITGLPGCGKTTLIKEILKEVKVKACGFYTQEIRENKKRVGFEIISLSGKKGILAHLNFESPYQVSKYKVNLSDLEEIGVKEILKGEKEGKVIVIDEIGKMELFSEKFRKAIEKIFSGKNLVLATITFKPNPFIDKIKKGKDINLFYLKRENFSQVKEKVKKIIEKWQRKKLNLL